jgi:hypothetical protein
LVLYRLKKNRHFCKQRVELKKGQNKKEADWLTAMPDSFSATRDRLDPGATTLKIPTSPSSVPVQIKSTQCHLYHQQDILPKTSVSAPIHYTFIWKIPSSNRGRFTAYINNKN